jgi:hypothetical protein
MGGEQAVAHSGARGYLPATQSRNDAMTAPPLKGETNVNPMNSIEFTLEKRAWK